MISGTLFNLCTHIHARLYGGSVQTLQKSSVRKAVNDPNVINGVIGEHAFQPGI